MVLRHKSVDFTRAGDRGKSEIVKISLQFFFMSFLFVLDFG